MYFEPSAKALMQLPERDVHKSNDGGHAASHKTFKYDQLATAQRWGINTDLATESSTSNQMRDD